MIKIATIADLHGRLPEIPECDLLLIAGDVSPYAAAHDQYWWLKNEFANWLETIVVPVVGIVGNHDRYFEEFPRELPPLKWTYLQESGTEVLGLRIYGIPHTLEFCNWAFNRTEEQLKRKWDFIPKDTDVILTHGPAFGYGDMTLSGKNIGSPSLLQRINEIEPRLVVGGHCHEGFGQWQHGKTLIVNCAVEIHPHFPQRKATVIEL